MLLSFVFVYFQIQLPLVNKEEIPPIAKLISKSRYPFLVLATIEVESLGKPRAFSSGGAIGLMQVMPNTGEWIARQHLRENFDRRDLFVPSKNIKLGIWYLEYLIDLYNGNLELALTAYNRGPGNVRSILSEYGKLPNEVKRFYSNKVLSKRQQLLTMRQQ